MARQMNDSQYQETLLGTKELGIDEGIMARMLSLGVLYPCFISRSNLQLIESPTATVLLRSYRHGESHGLGSVARRFDDEKLL